MITVTDLAIVFPYALPAVSYTHLDVYKRQGAHNPDAAYSLRRSLDEYFPNKRLIFIIGVFKDKDYDTILSITAPYAYKIFTVTPASKRGLDSAVLADKARKYCNNVIDAKNTHTCLLYTSIFPFYICYFQKFYFL